jgi:hypothetical protein
MSTAAFPQNYTLAVFDLQSPPTGTSTSIGAEPVVVVTNTHKTANTFLLDNPPGAYTAMRTFDRLGIMDFSGHVARLASSLSQIHFPESDRETGKELEDQVVRDGLAPFRDPITLKRTVTDVVQKVLRAYFGGKDKREGSEAKVTVLCTWNVKVSSIAVLNVDTDLYWVDK